MILFKLKSILFQEHFEVKNVEIRTTISKSLDEIDDLLSKTLKIINNQKIKGSDMIHALSSSKVVLENILTTIDSTREKIVDSRAIFKDEECNEFLKKMKSFEIKISNQVYYWLSKSKLFKIQPSKIKDPNTFQMMLAYHELLKSLNRMHPRDDQYCEMVMNYFSDFKLNNFDPQMAVNVVDLYKAKHSVLRKKVVDHIESFSIAPVKFFSHLIGEEFDPK